MTSVRRRANLPGGLSAIALLFLLVQYGVAADEWPQFRGPDGQGHTEAAGLPTTWSENENVVWKTAIPGRGWSSPVVSGNEIWLTTAIDEERSLRAIAVELDTGKLIRDVEVFRCENLPPINGKNSYASPTPVIESGRLYVHFGTFGTACVETATGQVLWTNRELTIDHKEGPGSSPVLCGDLLILNCDGIDHQYVAALKKQSGELAWRRDRPGPHNPVADFRKAYCTPLLIEVAGRPQVVSPGASRVVAYDPLTGDELWHVRYAGFSNVPRPVFAKGVVLVDTGYMKPQLWAIKPEGAGDVTETNVVWRCAKHAPANPSPVVVGDNVFMVSDAGIATCLNVANGKVAWQERLGGNFSASPLASSDKVYFTSEEGVTTVIAASDKFQNLASNKLDGRVLASPAVAAGSLILRTDGYLYRIDPALLSTLKRATKRPAAFSASDGSAVATTALLARECSIEHLDRDGD